MSLYFRIPTFWCPQRCCTLENRPFWTWTIKMRLQWRIGSITTSSLARNFWQRVRRWQLKVSGISVSKALGSSWMISTLFSRSCFWIFWNSLLLDDQCEWQTSIESPSVPHSIADAPSELDAPSTFRRKNARSSAIVQITSTTSVAAGPSNPRTTISYAGLLGVDARIQRNNERFSKMKRLGYF